MARTGGARSSTSEMALFPAGGRYEQAACQGALARFGLDRAPIAVVFAETSLRNPCHPAAVRARKPRLAREAFQAALLSTDNHVEWEEAAIRAADL